MSGPDGFDDEAFEIAFNTFDEDGSGTVEKDEMVAFIKQFMDPVLYGAADNKDEEEKIKLLQLELDLEQ